MQRLWTVKELTTELRFATPDACREWLRREHIPTFRRGKRVLLVNWVDVEKALRGQGRTA